MNELRSWITVFFLVLRYFAYRIGLCECPGVLKRRPEVVTVVNRVLRWQSRLRFVGLEHCPQSGPAIFAGNHAKWDDPICMYPAVFWGSNLNIEPYFMMRDDFFGTMQKTKFIDFDEVMRLFGTYQISRERVRMSQLKPFVKLLGEDDCFIMYPGRTRTRSGVFFEWREGMDEPGSVAFFIAHVQHSRPEVRIPAVPITRTYNPVTKGSAVVMGEPLYLAPKADREMQRDMDFRLLDRLGELVEINVPQIVCGILFLRCLHGKAETLEFDDLAVAVAQVLDDIKHRRIDPAAQAAQGREIKRTLKYLAKQRMVQFQGKQIELDVDAILSAPDIDTNYRKKNPVKYIFNHILHLKEVVSAIENAALQMR